MVYWSGSASWIGSLSNRHGTSERLCYLDTCGCKLQNDSRNIFVLLNNWCKSWLSFVVWAHFLVIEFQPRFQSPLSGSWERGAKCSRKIIKNISPIESRPFFRCKSVKVTNMGFVFSAFSRDAAMSPQLRQLQLFRFVTFFTANLKS